MQNSEQGNNDSTDNIFIKTVWLAFITGSVTETGKKLWYSRSIIKSRNRFVLTKISVGRGRMLDCKKI